MTDHHSEPGQGAFLPSHKYHRDLRLDACRGLALWFVFLDHMPGNSLSFLTLRNFGFSDASEIFIFISGYTCMLAYGGALQQQGWLTTLTRAIRRGLEIYGAFLLLLLAYIVLVWLFGDGIRYVDETNTGVFFRGPGAALAHAASLQYTPVNTDIVPLFVLLHLTFPAVLWALMTAPAITLTVSFLLYLIVQLSGLDLPAWPAGEVYFNPFAWQFLFVFGAWYAGAGASLIRPVVRSRATLVGALLYLALSLIVVLSWRYEILNLIPDQISRLIYPIHKGHLAPLRLLHFLALAVVISHLMPLHWHKPVRPLQTAIIRCGENSLSIYCFGVLLSFTGQVILMEVSSTLMIQVAVSVAGIVLMIVAATLATWEAQLDRRGPKLF